MIHLTWPSQAYPHRVHGQDSPPFKDGVDIFLSSAWLMGRGRTVPAVPAGIDPPCLHVNRHGPLTYKIIYYYICTRGHRDGIVYLMVRALFELTHCWIGFHRLLLFFKRALEGGSSSADIFFLSHVFIIDCVCAGKKDLAAWHYTTR